MFCNFVKILTRCMDTTSIVANLLCFPTTLLRTPRHYSTLCTIPHSLSLSFIESLWPFLLRLTLLWKDPVRHLLFLLLLPPLTTLQKRGEGHNTHHQPPTRLLVARALARARIKEWRTLLARAHSSSYRRA